jgi:CelD/BcsL family acetyltransferase involved in cellulose biosynthesis
VPPIDELASGWEPLAASHATLPTQDLPWALASLAAFEADPEPFLRGSPAAPDAIAPLGRQRGRLELLGTEMFEPGDLLARSPTALAELAAAMVAPGSPLLLKRLPADSPSIDALREAVGARGVVRVDGGDAHPLIELDDRWQEPGGGLSSSRRSALRRGWRRAEEIGPVTVEMLAPAAEELDDLLDLAFAIEFRSWKGDAGTALLQDPVRATFIRRYAAETAARGQLRVQFLKIGDSAVAMQIGIEWKRRIWLLKIGYDRRYAASSPGQLLLAESVADAARRGLATYQFLGCAVDWTRAWSTEEQACVTVRVYPASARAARVLVGDAGAVMAREARRRAAAARERTSAAAASRYVAGPALEDALRVEALCADAAYLTTVGFWGTSQTSARTARDQCLLAAEALPAGSELAVKVHALGGDGPVLDRLLDRCVERGVGLHLDALWPETAEESLGAAIRLAERAPRSVGCTLTGRWRRSVDDAVRLGGSELKVRVVKSEWPDPTDPDRDPVAGCLEVVEALAGAGPRVALATQDKVLAAAGLDLLVAAGAAAEMQVLYAMHSRATVRLATARGIPVRVYVPYGHGRVPYATDRIATSPKLASKVAFDVLPLRPWLGRRLLLSGRIVAGERRRG